MTNIIEITSLKNELIKMIYKLQDSKHRKESGLILLDGEKTILGLIEDGVEFEYLFLKKDNPIKANSKNVVYVTDEILKKLSTVKTASSMVGVIKEPGIKQEDFINLDKIILIENIKDSGNLGTIIRSANAFGVRGIILFGDCVDLYSAKVIRSATQNMFKIPVLRTSDIELIKKLKKNHKLISTVVRGGEDFMKYDFKKPFILAFGSEADGISAELANLSDDKLTLFMDNNVESLNLGICASIACFWIKFNS